MSKTILVIPDTHVPYHDKAAWKEVLRCIKDLEPHEIVIIGDFADFYAISSHDRDPIRKRFLLEEVAEVNKALDQIPTSPRRRSTCFIEGNHEDRLRRYLWSKAPELFGTVNVPTLFKLKERGWKHRAYRHGLKVGKVTYKHDFSGMAGKNAAKASLMAFGGNLVIGHSHRGEVTYLGEGRPDGDSHFCLNVGWLGRVDEADYMDPSKARRDWQHGFGLVDYSRSGLAYAQFVPIVRGKAAKPI